MTDAMQNSRGMRRILALALCAGLVAVSGCAKKSERVFFDGKYYPTKARAADKSDRHSFVVSVRRADQGLKGARAAGDYGGKQYCLKHYGTSEIRWSVGPDAPAAALARSGSGLAFSGRCVLW